MNMDQKELYFRDILPEIGDYVLKQGSANFSTGQISDRLPRYTEDEIDSVLDHVADRSEVNHLEKQGDSWSLLLFESEEWDAVDRELEESSQKSVELPDVKTRLKELSAQEYGKLRNNLSEVYRGLQEIADEDSSYFKTKDLKKRVREVRPAEVGIVLSGLTAAGLINRYGGNAYDPDSIDTDRIREFRDAVEEIESFEEFKDLIEQRTEE